MRVCIESSEGSYPFYVDEVLSVFGEEIKNFNWIFTDIEGYIFHEKKEVTLPEFEGDLIMLTGSEFYSIIQKYNILLIFGVITCVSLDFNINEADEFPSINDNSYYWSRNYKSPLEEAKIEFGFFDTTVVIVTTNEADLVGKLKRSFPAMCTLDAFLEKS